MAANINGHASRPAAHPHEIPARPWKLYLPASAVNHRSWLGQLSPRLFTLMIQLEMLCRDKAYCNVSNALLCNIVGVKTRALQYILRNAEQAGLIHRQMSESGETVRHAIFLLKRPDENLPVIAIETDREMMGEIITTLQRRSAPEGVQKPAPEGVQKPAPEGVQKPAPCIKNIVVVEGNENSKNSRANPPERQRPDTPDPEPEREAPAPEPSPPPAENLMQALMGGLFGMPPSAAQMAPRPAPPRPPAPVIPPPPPPAPAAALELTPSQRQWLASLTEPERQRFAELPAKGQAFLLDPHRDGVNDDRIIASEARKLLAPKATAAPPPPMPATTAELWERLPHGPPGWVQHAANDLVRDFADAKYRPAFEGLAKGVWQGNIDPAKVLDALRQAMKPGIEKRGALFCHALKQHGVRWEGSSP